MKSYLLILISILSVGTQIVNAEIVKNSAGEKIELKSNGTWVKVPVTEKDLVNDGQRYNITIDDGNKQPVEVSVIPDITLMGIARPLTKDEINFQIKMSSLSAQYKLKNKYSYKPKEVYVTQKGNDVKIRINHTGENGYGAAVPGSYESTFYIEKNGKLKQTSSMF
ncbi:hypothetical protein [Acinetobacter seifertii]|uniref:hypothetical protein n=1 Tax=Acinetobacter seifertii TaxID=1530123 RepID=UPI00158030A9|nr:hypothetical protein [Acinetobacter seifertii]MCH2000994.1 hypothetical protein [Acinetobacter seifertii]NUG13404.1 hypothetical protein [Acinetobacter seifertii]